ncbi:UDP-N-acetylglucosamine 1-carboxyvinyltransferase, partial [mine drainage metagenome]
MALYRIDGGNRLIGSVQITGSKNSALPIVTAAALAANGESVIDNIPRYTDIIDLIHILRALGAKAEFIGEKTLHVDARELNNHVAPYELARRLRGSTYIVGLLLARLGKADVAVPGGCEIGARPVDFHIKGFEALGARAWVEHGSIQAETPKLAGARFYVDRKSHGTTCNLMIAASLADGTTVLENAAQEPEIVDLANFLNAMGGRVRGAGT